MNEIADCGGRGELRRQARVALGLGSPFVAALLEAGERQIDHAPLTARMIASWPHDPSASALAMRFNAALHALARRDSLPALTALYRGEHQDFDGAIAAALASEDDFIAQWMLDTPQTNEVGRAAAIGAALMVVRQETDLPCALLELGSSCGLNLNLARYAYDLGGIAAGAAQSPVRIAPAWRGAAPVHAPIEIVAARGIDLNPLDAGNEATRERLLAYIWADQPGRAARLEQALALARLHPPQVDEGHAAPWLAAQLETPQPAGLCRVVFHSMVLQYLSAQERESISDTVQRAGRHATAQRPFAWIRFEWTPMRSEVQLSLTCWPGGEKRLLATCHAYGDWIDWRR
ncbi:DUF2332 domain-containing protein [Sphingobium boeckii]|uniref:DUF2332 domain-containing protein n=1 Tax=Sphingobium boeckii TaxID=1082345 RepID=A0A7W9EF58_9SPHN|nr:DUF2332 family protein [Sphingobium boeckii]MBB5685371.1 hypothetical protein [Sphingobium boeckii]